MSLYRKLIFGAVTIGAVVGTVAALKRRNLQSLGDDFKSPHVIED